MPYSHVHRMTKGNLNPTKLKMNNCSTNLPYASDDDFMELLWENGQVVMQRHSVRDRKRSLSPIPIQERDGNNDAPLVQEGKYAVIEFNVNRNSTSRPSGRVHATHDDDLVPSWLNRPVEDSLQVDYSPEFLPDMSSPNPKTMSEQNCSVPVMRNGRFSQAAGDPKVVSARDNANLEHDNVSKVGGRASDLVKFRSSSLFPSSQQYPASDPKSGSSALLPNNTQQLHCLTSSATPVAAARLPNSMKLKKYPLPRRPLQASNNTGLMNFSHFSRPAALFEASTQKFASPGVGASGTDKFRGSDKAPFICTNSIGPSVVRSTSTLPSTADEELISARAKDDPQPPRTRRQEVDTTKKLEAVCRKDASRNHGSPDHNFESSSFAASFALGHPKAEKAFITSVASSSACSGNSTEGASHVTKHGLKRKGQVAEESESQSDDVEDESVDVKRPTKGSKRSRSAEVHNLSERRRRDRINEKMRALQELIPNCNKTDKASMLDEAIEYLKTLQLQVQIMSMGTGLCMSPIMFPAGIQKIPPSPIPHFPPMGMGMNMGMGMGMHDISRSSGYPLISVPPMQGLQFPCASVSGVTSLLGLPGTSAQMFGFPGQALSSSLPRAPFIPLSGFSSTILPLPDLSVAAAPMPLPNSSLSSNSKSQIQDTNLRKMHKKMLIAHN